VLIDENGTPELIKPAESLDDVQRLERLPSRLAAS